LGPYPGPIGPPANESQDREEAARKLWAVLSPEDQDDLDLHVVVKTGAVPDIIAATVEEEHADIAVLGTHGRRWLGRLVVGSTTEAMLRKMPIPVLTVSHVIRPMAFRRILFATDLSEASSRGLTSAMDLARTLGAEIIAMHALGSMAMMPREYPEPVDFRKLAFDEARRRMGQLISEGRLHNVKVEPLITEGHPATEILRVADETMADIILLTVERKNVVERVLMGTTAEHVVRQAGVPVLTIPVNVAVRAARLDQAG
jgi:nucleotide-binding universal stress UspA family protein